MDDEKTQGIGQEESGAEADAFQAGFEEEGGFLETAEENSAPEPGGETHGAEAGEPPEAAEEPGAEPQAPPEAGAGGGAPAAQQAPPRTWTLDLNGQRVHVGEADLLTLARKGAGYDAVSQAYEAARPMAELIADFAEQAGMSPQEYVSNLRAQMKQAQGMSQEEARRAVAMEDRERAVREREDRQRAAAEAQRVQQRRQQAEEARRRAEIQEFMQVFPEAAGDIGNIPAEVWEGVRGGLSLTAS